MATTTDQNDSERNNRAQIDDDDTLELGVKHEFVNLDDEETDQADRRRDPLRQPF